MQNTGCSYTIGHNTRIEILSTPDGLADRAAGYFTDVVNKSMEISGRVLVALSGGGTPLLLYDKLSSAGRESQIPWKKIHFFWGDERLVPEDDAESNYHQARTHLLDKVPVLLENIHPIKTRLAPREAAREYESQLVQFTADGNHLPVFDLVFLGLGEDGHIASLFPGVENPGEDQEPVIAVRFTYQDRPAGRVTFTPLIINLARHICFLVSGTNKAEALLKTLTGEQDPVNYPAQRICPVQGEVVWLVEENAGRLLLEWIRIHRTGEESQ